MFHPLLKGWWMISGPKNQLSDNRAFCARPVGTPLGPATGQDRDERCEAKLTVVLRPGGGQNCIDEAQRRRCGDVGHEKNRPLLMGWLIG